MEEGRKRRETVAAACESCRRRKVKCDGNRPCRGCSSLETECVYNARGGETQRQAQKRKYDDLASLHESLRTSDEGDALALLHRIRAGEPLETIVSVAHPVDSSSASKLRASVPSQSHSPLSDRQSISQVDEQANGLTSAIVAVSSPKSAGDWDSLDGHVVQRIDGTDGAEPISVDLLLDIMNELRCKRRAVGLDIWQRLRRLDKVPSALPQLQSSLTARRQLDDAADRVSLMHVLLRGSATLPAIVEFLESNEWRGLTFDSRIQTPDNMRKLIHVQPSGNRVQVQAVDALTGADADRVTTSSTSLALPAAPWTSVTDDSRLVSHLISIFLLRENACWRFLEEEPFLQDMRRAHVGSEYCSPLLVNAVCSLSCQSSSEPGAFTKPGNWLQRGQQFYNEAIRLWLNEMGKPSLTTIQALGVLTLSAGCYARDRFGMNLCSVALQMNQYLLWPPSGIEKGSDQDLALRVRTCATWAIHHIHIGCQMGLLKPAVEIDSRLGITPNLPDEVRIWTSFPHGSTTYDFRPNVLLRERCMLNRMCVELTHLLFGNQRPSDWRRLFSSVQSLDERLSQWRDFLPIDLRYDRARPVPIYDLHFQFLCTVITLWSAFDDLDETPTSGSTSSGNRSPDSLGALPEDIRKTASNRKYDCVLDMARVLADYRTEYSLEPTGCYCFQTEAIASFSALRLLADYRHGDLKHDLPENAQYRLEAAFEEAFRCLLGTGAQLAVAAGVARMVLQTAEQLNVMPHSVSRALNAIQPMFQSAYRPPETSSAYVNYALARRSQADEEARMDQLLKKAENLNIDA